ncbi:aldehyde dehydrogenase [Radiobacillus sp. PE A8.2]|uniref:aldehyde dehydrogenase n=1 Tax=Radiobacillus sp. PE A8.2 TaxID=3380349 RepID=UPI0038909C0C
MENYQSLIDEQKEFFNTNTTKDVAFRLEALDKLKTGIKQHEDALLAALKEDLNKSAFDAYSTEIGFTLQEISFIERRLRAWAKPKKVKKPITHIGTKSLIYPEPYGVSLIIAPWNYPFQLAVAPLLGAIAAGNCAIIKPSEFTPKTSQVLQNIIAELFPEKYIAVVQGGVETSQALLSSNVDYIFFTGSVPVGKIVMKAAAENLVPVTLELGGKSPCIVHEDANIKLAAKRIAWGKFTNAGQTCIAPDYLYVHKNVKEQLLTELRAVIKDFFGNNPLENENYTHIVNEQHFNRLSAYLTNGETIIGGNSNKEELSIEPTVLTTITWDDPIMKDEIFGPILPAMEYGELSEVITGISQHPNPLALYLFTENDQVEEKILENVSFGGGCINDTLYHLSTPYLPFGGVGTSGHGAYHGKSSFDTFSHQKSVMKQTNLFDMSLRYPNAKNGLKKIKKYLK